MLLHNLSMLKLYEYTMHQNNTKLLENVVYSSIYDLLWRSDQLFDLGIRFALSLSSSINWISDNLERHDDQQFDHSLEYVPSKMEKK